MISKLLAGAICTCGGLWIASSLWAQRAPTGASAPAGVALLDVASIATGSQRVKQSLETLKRQYEQDAAALKKESEAGNALTEQVRKLPSGPERKKAEEGLMKKRADFELHGKRLRDESAASESKVYNSLAREIREELARYCEATGVKLVLRNDPTPPELIERPAIATEIQKFIVYQRDADITPLVLDELNRRAAPGATSRAPARQSGPQR